jgi:hypothetical protein
MATEEQVIADLEKQVGDLEAKVDEALEKRESDSMPDSREVVRPKKGKKPGMKLHDNKATHVTKGKADDGDDEEDDEDDDDMNKAKKKSSDNGDDEEDDDMDKAEDVEKAKKAKDDGEDGEDVDTWSENADAKKKGKMKKKADETLIFKGQTIVKSKVGAAQFDIFKAMVGEMQDNAAKLAKAEDETLMANLRKRADDDFKHVPGSTEQRALMLKAIGAMSEDMRKSFEAVFKSAEKLATAAFSTLGVNSFNKSGTVDDLKKGADDFVAKVTEIAVRDKVTKDVAMQKARKEHPDLFKAYQGNN